MSELRLDGGGLTREDEVLARVVVDLGLATALDVKTALAQLAEARAKGDGRTLSDVLRERGCLRPRFASAVEKAVKTRLAAERPPSAAGTPAGTQATAERLHPGIPDRTADRPDLRPQTPRPSPSEAPANEPGLPGSTSGLAPDAEARVAGGAPAGSPADQPGSPSRPPAEPVGAAQAGTSEEPDLRPGVTGRTPEEPDLRLPEAATYRPAPKGAGFSVRSKKDVASAWAAYRKGPSANAVSSGHGEPPPPSLPDRAPPGSDLGPPAGREPAPGLRPREPEPLSLAGTSPAAGPAASLGGTPIAPPNRADIPERPRASAEAGPPGNQGRTAGEAEARQKSFRPARRRVASSGVTQSIDIESIKAELGLDKKADKAPAEPEAVPADSRQKEIALRAFIRRALPSTVHQRCLEATLRRRLTVSSPARLAEEAGVSEREARRVLDSWKAAGLARQEDPELFQYQFAPSKADLAMIKEFMTLWNDEGWHRRLLGWILEEEAL